MKVLHVIPSIAPRYGGPSRAVVEMCRALGKRGIDTLIATTDADGAGRLEVETDQLDSYENVPAIFFRRQWSEAYKYSRPLAQWLSAHVAGFDVVHIHAVFSHACLAAARACRKRSVPYVIRPLGTLDPWSLKQKSLRKGLFLQLGVKQMLNNAAAIHYTTLTEQKLVEDSLDLKRGVVIPLGIESDLFKEAKEAKNSKTSDLNFVERPYVLVLSRLHQKKGLDLLLPAFLSLVKRDEFARWKLVLAGEGDMKYVDSLKNLVKSYGGNGNIVFAGWLDGVQREAVLRGASLLALTSHQENFGLCVVEALACGVPVLVSPHVNLSKEIQSAGAGWISALDRVALESKLTESLQSEMELARRGEIGKHFVRRHFTWSNVAGEIEALYRSFI